MRIAAVACCSHTNALSEPEVLIYQRMARVIRKFRNGTLYLILPADLRFIDKVPKVEGLHYVKLGKYRRFNELMGTMPPNLDEYLNYGYPKLFADAVMVVRTGIAGHIQRMLWRGEKEYIPVIVDEAMAADYSSPMLKNLEDIDLISRSFSYAMCQPIFHTTLEKATALRACRRFFKEKICSEVSRKSWIAVKGISFERVRRVKSKVKRKNAKFTLFFGGRLNAMKRKRFLVEIYEKFFAAGRPIRIVITSPTGWTPGERIPPGFEVLERVPPDEFVERCCKAHAYLASSRIEGFSVGFVEQLVTGIVAVLPDLPWAAALLKDRWSKYPFKYKNGNQAYGWLKWIYENYEEACKRISWVPEWVEEEYHEEKCLLDIHDRIKNLVAGRWPPPKLGGKKRLNPNSRLVLSHVDRMPKKFHIRDLIQSIVRGDDNAYRIACFSQGSKGRFTAQMMYMFLSELPWLKDLGGRQPEFEKADSYDVEAFFS